MIFGKGKSEIKKIRELKKEIEELKQKPNLNEVFDNMDWATLWNEDLSSSSWMAIVPIISAVLSLIILIIVLVKK